MLTGLLLSPPGQAPPLETDDAQALARARMHAALGAGPAYDARRVAIIAPLSGAYAQVGARVVEAVELAAVAFDAEVLALDSEGDPERAAELLRRVALDEAVAGVIGPVGQLSARRAAAQAGHLGVVTITLSSARRPPAISPFAFRHRLSHVEEAERLGRHAVEAMELKRLAILYPDTAVGQARMAGFWRGVEAAGGEIRGAEAYSIHADRFDAPITRLIGRHPDQKGRVSGAWRRFNRKRGDRAMRIRPQVDFDGVFIAEGGTRARLILPFLAHWDIPLQSGMFPPTSPLKRAPVWVFSTRDLAPWAERLGRPGLAVRFLSTWTPANEDGADFVAAWQARHKDTPGEIAAHAYDAATILLSRARTVDSGAALAAAMRAPWEGILGRCTVDAQGEVRSTVRVMGAEPGVGLVELGALDAPD